MQYRCANLGFGPCGADPVTPTHEIVPTHRYQNQPVAPRHLRGGGLVLPLILVVSTGALGEDPAAGGRNPPLSVVENVRLVLLPAAVTTRRGKPVYSLAREDFRLEESGALQRIDVFATEQDAPLRLAFLLDVSGSMRLSDRLGEAKRAIRVFVDALDRRDGAALFTFADERVECVAGFDRGPATLLERLEAQQPSGRTALYDALAAMPRLVDESTTGRKAIVLITDGVDNASQIPSLRATWLARRVAVPIYTLGFIPMQEKLLPERVQDALEVVERFSEETGGTTFPIHDASDVDRAAAQIHAELRFQYVIGFYPSAGQRDGSFRTLDLTTTREDLLVRTRRGYYASP